MSGGFCVWTLRFVDYNDRAIRCRNDIGIFLDEVGSGDAHARMPAFQSTFRIYSLSSDISIARIGSLIDLNFRTPR